jgi:(R,R)-butanediol dehydrogenase / meso-butanediol dehydrogenase / diacetyl reductase
VDVPEPTAGAGQVKVRVSRNGICGTDLHEYFAGPIFIPLSEPHPLTGKKIPLVFRARILRHRHGSRRRVTDVREDDRGTIEPVYRCGECRPCQAGRYNLCQAADFHGLMAHGGRH